MSYGYSTFILGLKSLDMSSDMCPSVKALGHMCNNKVCVSPDIIYI